MRLTLKAINAELAKRGYNAQLAKGDSYLYFSGGEATDWVQRTVTASSLSSLTIDQWMAEFERLRKLNEEIFGAPEPSKPAKAAVGQRVWLVEKPGGVFREVELARPTPGINQ